MRLYPNNSFNIYWKKQVLAFQVMAIMHVKKKKLKTGLKANYAAQTIVSELDESVERNLDYLLSVNTLTSYLLLLVKKPVEALEFIKIANRVAMKLLDSLLNPNRNTPLAVIGESGDSHPSGPTITGKKSQVTGMLLSNYILAINLMKSVATKYAFPKQFDEVHAAQLKELENVELALQEVNRASDASNNVAILYLVKQHRFEILEAHADYSTVLQLSFN